MCRHELPTDDPKYEEMKVLKVVCYLINLKQFSRKLIVLYKVLRVVCYLINLVLSIGYGFPDNWLNSAYRLQWGGQGDSKGLSRE